MSNQAQGGKNANVELSPEEKAKLAAIIEAATTAARETAQLTTEQIVGGLKNDMNAQASEAVKNAAGSFAKSAEATAKVEKASKIAYYASGALFFAGSMITAGLAWNKARKSSNMPEPATAAASPARGR